MGVVYLAFDSLLMRHVAIKSLLRPQSEELQTWQESVRRLIREAQAAGSLHHVNIVAIYDVIPDGDSPSIIMEFIDGKTLSQFVTPGKPMEARHVISIMSQCSAALDHGHVRGVVHRDIKPSNIMLDDAGLVRLTDFGIAKQLSSNTDLTHGLALGTLEYMSPEQLEGKVVDGSSDQYSLAVMGYQLLTGYKIFDANTFGAWCAMIIGQEPLAASKRFEGLPVGVDPVLSRAMSKVPSFRYHTCCEFATDLEHALTRHGAQVGAGPVPPVVQAPLVPPADSLPPAIRANAIVSSSPPTPNLPDLQQAINTPSVVVPERHGRSRVLAICFAAVAVLVVAGTSAIYFIERHSSHPIRSKTYSPMPAEVPQPVQSPPAPVIEEFASSALELRTGESAVLRWAVQNATEISISGIGQDLPPHGTRIVKPDASVTYTLRISGRGGSVERNLTVTVTRLPDPPVIKSFNSSRVDLQSGQATVLQWEVSGATNISIEGIGHISPGQTSRPVCPTASKRYVIVAIGPGGTVHKSVNVSVSIPPGVNVKLNQFAADPATIARGQSSVLRWAVQNASMVRIDPGIGQVDACGVLTVRPQITTKYELTYQNDRGTLRSRPVIITVQ